VTRFATKNNITTFVRNYKQSGAFY